MSLFNEETNDQNSSLVNDTNTHVEIPENPMEALVGEGKKYKTVEDLAKSVFYKEQFIETLKKENSTYKEALNKREKSERLEELIQELLQRNSDQSKDTTPKVPETPTNDSPNLTEDLLEKKINEHLTKRSLEAQKRANLSIVKEKLIESFGSEYASVLQAKATELGMSNSDIDDLASRNPKLFFKTFDVGTTNSTLSLMNTPKTQVNTAANTSISTSGAKPKSFYDKLKNTDKAKYLSDTVRKQMMKDAQTLGNFFFDN